MKIDKFYIFMFVIYFGLMNMFGLVLDILKVLVIIKLKLV